MTHWRRNPEISNDLVFWLVLWLAVVVAFIGWVTG